MHKFPMLINYHLLRYTSDHTPILLVFSTNINFRANIRAKSYLKKFEHIWLQDSSCLHIIKVEWPKLKGVLRISFRSCSIKFINGVGVALNMGTFLNKLRNVKIKYMI
jgi:hypothetical protein